MWNEKKLNMIPVTYRVSIAISLYYASVYITLDLFETINTEECIREPTLMFNRIRDNMETF